MAIDLPSGIQQALDESLGKTNPPAVGTGTVLRDPNAVQPTQPAPAANADLTDTAAPDLEPTYDPGSLADKISKAYLQHLAENQPKKPGPSTGQKVMGVVQGAMNAFGDAAHASDTKGGWLSGIANTLNARNQRLAQQGRDEDLHAKSQAETIAMHRNIYLQDQKIQDEATKANQSFVDMNKPNHKIETINHDELVKRMQDPKFADEHWVRQTGSEPEIGANGEPLKDKFGNPASAPVYTVITRNTLDGQPDNQVVDEATSADIKKYMGQDMPKGTKLTGDQMNAINVQLNSTRNAVNILQHTNGKELSPDEMRTLSPYLTDPLIQAAISSVPGSSYKGLLQFQTNADALLNGLQQKLDAATKAGDKNAVQAISEGISDIKKEEAKVKTFTSAAILPSQVEKYEKEGNKQEEWVDKYLHDPNSLSGDKASAALPQIKAALDAATEPGLRAKLTSAYNTAKTAQENYFSDMQRKAKADQVAKQGDPVAAGKDLAQGLVTLTDLRTRQTTADFILQATEEARKVDPSYNPADEVNFEHVAKSPQAAVFFGSARSLMEKGGTLDQLYDWGKKIPDNTLPTLNTVEDWVSLKAGKGPLAGYAALVLGVADDYGKVMGGGSASDSARDHALSLFAAAQNQKQRVDAIRGTLGGVSSQYHGRIGNNKFLQREYGDFVRSDFSASLENVAPPKNAKPNMAPGKAADGTTVWPMADGTIQDAQGNKYNPQTGKRQ